MLEDSATRAIVIAVGLFVIMLTLTAILLYVFVAKDLATSVGNAMSDWDEITINNVMEYDGDIDLDAKGIDVINLLRKYILREDVKIKLGEYASFVDISTFKNSIGNLDEHKILNIDTAADVIISKKIEEDIEGQIIKIEIKGDIYKASNAVDNAILYGDIDSNGVINSDDKTKLENYINSRLTRNQLDAFDVNDDGKVNVTDKNIIQAAKNRGEILMHQDGVTPRDIGNYSQAIDLINDYLNYDLTANAKKAADLVRDGVIDNNDLNKLDTMI